MRKCELSASASYSKLRTHLTKALMGHNDAWTRARCERDRGARRTCDARHAGAARIHVPLWRICGTITA